MPDRRYLANAIRMLSVDAIARASSGHPGAPLGMADMAEALFRHGFRHNPSNPAWPDRDRFVLSNGHASMLLYAVLHLCGYDLSMEDIRNFRQWGSRTPGHPECDVTPGVEMTTGPLGQGIASAVGMALAERMLAHRFNISGHTIVDHRTYVFLGDGCLMEGVSQEACSLAGTWGLGRLIAMYDANGISIDGHVAPWFSEDVGARFRSLGWQVVGPIDGHDADALDGALAEARADLERPSLIICRTHIGFGSPEADTSTCHGSPLKGAALEETRRTLGWKEPPFSIPSDVYAAWDAREAGRQAEAEWNAAFAAYRQEQPELAREFERRMAGMLPDNWEALAESILCEAVTAGESLATRTASLRVLEHMVGAVPELVGGSADLSSSACTLTSKSEPVQAGSFAGNYVYYGVREFGMSAIMNGLALHGGFIPYGGTFMSFSDQAKNALRLAAISGVRGVWVFTHDSVGVGEDGPTHQPVEQVPSLRLVPNLHTWRPCDTVETAVAWKSALEKRLPTCLSLSRQTLPFLSRETEQLGDIARGGYILRDCQGLPDIILLASGSEVALIVEAAERLGGLGYNVRIVSMPCTEIFDAQPASWKEQVLPSRVRRRLAVEAASPDFWWKYVGLDGAVIGMDRFGISAPGAEALRRLGFTVDNVVAAAEALLKQ